MTLDLFEPSTQTQSPTQRLGTQALILRGFALPYVAELLGSLEIIEKLAPSRNMVTRGDFRMSVAMSNCGSLGWVSDERGYRYTDRDPRTTQRWPDLPDVLAQLACSAADAAGFSAFAADACLINRYRPGARMSLHQDKNERDFNAPIVSVSLGLPATFLFGGSARRDRPTRALLAHGDVVVWGGVDRLRFHGIAPLRRGRHFLLGEQRINLTLRKAG